MPPSPGLKLAVEVLILGPQAKSQRAADDAFGLQFIGDLRGSFAFPDDKFDNGGARRACCLEEVDGNRPDPKAQ